MSARPSSVRSLTVAPLPVQAKHWVSAELPCTGSEALRSEKMVDDPREVLVGALHEKVLSAISDKQFHEKKEDLLHAAVASGSASFE